MGPIRVLVVDDSVVIRRLVTDVLSADPDIEVVGFAANGLIALGLLERLSVDVITLDLEMPVLDGLGTLKRLRELKLKIPVIMFSTLTERGGQLTLSALSAGAKDYVTKPANMGSVTESRESVRSELIPRIKALAARTTTPRPPTEPTVVPAVPRPVGPRATPKALVIGCSTGGPEALAAVLAVLPASFPLPILVVQHMPRVFTKLFAERLDRTCPLRVVEATTGETVTPGTVFIAPGSFHLEVAAGRTSGVFVTRLHEGPRENSCRPSVDVLFRSAAAAYGDGLLAVVLTGMGSDGCQGSAAIRAANGVVLAQDRETSVVWGMPGSVVQQGLADEVLPLPDIGPAIVRLAMSTGRRRVVEAANQPSVVSR
jgi:two-component system, chemotaxis family, protein-glutamate methylesterase/glutaminase